MSTADRIKHLLKARGVAERSIRRELADLCKISQQAVAQWFGGDTKKISPEHLAKIAANWGTTMEWLVTGRGGMDSAAAEIAVSIELDELIGLLYARQTEFSAEHFAALDSLVDNLRIRAAARFQQAPQGSDKE